MCWIGSEIMDGNITRQEFQGETAKIYDKLNKHDRQISVLEVLVENLKDLPSAITSLEKTMALMGQNLEILNSKVDSVVTKEETIIAKDKEQDKILRKLDDKSKIDILSFIKSNWWRIFFVICLAWVFIKQMIIS